jgi:hypothetical protein
MTDLKNSANEEGPIEVASDGFQGPGHVGDPQLLSKGELV